MSPKKQAGSGFNLTQGAACSVFVVSPSFLQHMTNALALLMSIYRESKKAPENQHVSHPQNPIISSI